MDNLGIHKNPAIRAALRKAGAKLFSLPPYSPDLNPIEQVFAKLKHLRRKAADRTLETTWRRIGDLLDHFAPEECANDLMNASRFRTALFTAAALLLAGPAAAADKEDYLLATAADLAALCGAPADVSAMHMCEGFLVGAHRVFETIGAALGDPLYCLPTDGSASRDTAARDFAAWIAATPDAASRSPSDGPLRWARTTYPCG